jgi:hypothetical protein
MWECKAGVTNFSNSNMHATEPFQSIYMILPTNLIPKCALSESCPGEDHDGQSARGKIQVPTAAASAKVSASEK